jgi:type IV pilus assembly protein PilX
MTNQARPSSQTGISLVIVLIFLVVLSMLGIASMQQSTLTAGIARNEIDRNIAFQAAESALRDAENDLRYKNYKNEDCAVSDNCRTEPVTSDQFTIACSDGLCDTKTRTTPIWTLSTAWDTSGQSIEYGRFTNAPDIPMVAQQPRYLVEHFNIGGNDIVRITAVGWGFKSSTRATLQTTVKINLKGT